MRALCHLERAGGILGKALCRARLRKFNRQLFDILTDERANAFVTEFMTRKIRKRVHDPEIAERLIPKNHGFGLRRLLRESGHFESYNCSNVRLVDLNETPIERITAEGARPRQNIAASISWSTRPALMVYPVPLIGATFVDRAAGG